MYFRNFDKNFHITSDMIAGSGVNKLGNNQGTDVPIAPVITPFIAPIITSDFNSILACLIDKTFI